METEALAPTGAADEPVEPQADPKPGVARDPDAKISFATFSHELRRDRPLANALRASLKIRKGDIATAMFTRGELQEKLDALLAPPDAKEAT